MQFPFLSFCEECLVAASANLILQKQSNRLVAEEVFLEFFYQFRHELVDEFGSVVVGKGRYEVVLYNQRGQAVVALVARVAYLVYDAQKRFGETRTEPG